MAIVVKKAINHGYSRQTRTKKTPENDNSIVNQLKSKDPRSLKIFIMKFEWMIDPWNPSKSRYKEYKFLINKIIDLLYQGNFERACELIEDEEFILEDLIASYHLKR